MKSAIFYFSCAVIILNLFQPCLTQLDPETETLIQRLIENYFIPENNVTGMSLSIVQNGETILSKGYLYQDIENGILATNRTLFSIGSITKSFIGTLVVKTLSEKFPESGESILDVPVAQLISNFNFTLSDRYRAESVSFRDLLSHRTCLSNSGDLTLLFGTMKYDSNLEYQYRTRFHKQGCEFRNGFLYNNAIYALTGELIANVAGKSIQQLVREFIAEIGMTDSTTIDVSGSYETNPLMSQGYFIKDGNITRFNQKLLKFVEDITVLQYKLFNKERNDVSLGAGGILSTSNDMAQYGLFHLNQGKVGDKQVVSKEAMSWIYKVSSSDNPSFSGQGGYGYGLGLGLALWNGDQWINHNGYWAPYSSSFSFFPGLNISIFMVTNGPGFPNSPVSQSFIAIKIVDILKGAAKPMNSEQMTPKQFHSALRSSTQVSHFGYEFDAQSLRKNGLLNMNSVLNNQIDTKRTKIDNEVLGVYGGQLSGDLYILLDPADNSSLRMNYGEGE